MSPQRTVLLQLDTDAQPSVFDAVVAVDAGVEVLLRHGGVTPEVAPSLVHGCLFTRGPKDLKNTAIFVGGGRVEAAEAVLAAVKGAFFGPFRVSVLFDPNGASTTAAAAVAILGRHERLAGATCAVLGGTGPVGARVARLLAREGARVRIVSRSLARAQATAAAVRQATGLGEPSVTGLALEEGGCSIGAVLEGASLVVAAGAQGVTLLDAASRSAAAGLKVAVDLNAVPPAGIEGVEAKDAGAEKGGVLCYGALGVGGLKMKVHRRALRALFEAADVLWDAEECLRLAKEALEGAAGR